MDKKKISIILGVLLAVFAVIGARTYIVSLEKKYVREEKRGFVLVASAQIPSGTIIDETMVKFESVPVKYIQPRALNSQSRQCYRRKQSEPPTGQGRRRARTSPSTTSP